MIIDKMNRGRDTREAREQNAFNNLISWRHMPALKRRPDDENDNNS